MKELFAFGSEELTPKKSREEFDDFLTICCKAKYYRKSKAFYCCCKCDTDITIDWYYFHKARLDEEE